MLAMPGDEAYRLGAPLQDAFNGIGHLTQIHGVVDLCAAAFRLYDDGVVQLHTVIPRRGKFRVEIEHPYPEMRLLPSYYGEHLLCGVGVIILAVVEIGQNHIVLQAACDCFQFRAAG